MNLVACNWCINTHIADVSCTCKEPCKAGWCPAGVAAEMAAEVKATQTPA